MEGGGDGWSKGDGFMVWHETFRRMWKQGVSKERCSFGRGDGVKFLRSVEKVKVGY